jgi:predicted DNA-binding transcriptional regulator AlpA
MSKKARSRLASSRDDAMTREAELLRSLLSPVAAGHDRLLGKEQICELTGRSFPTIWAWMRAGKFPRARVLAGRSSVWLQSEVNEWMKTLPLRPYRPDDAAEGDDVPRVRLPTRKLKLERPADD